MQDVLQNTTNTPNTITTTTRIVSTVPTTPTPPTTPTIPNLSSLHIGQIFSNYKSLCSCLGIPVLSGNSKIAQIKELKRHISLEKIDNNQSYMVTGIYLNPLPKQDKRLQGTHQKYSQHIKSILLYTLKEMYNKYGDATLDTSRNQMLFRLNMVNRNYIILCNNGYIEEFFKNPRLFISTQFIDNYITRTKNRLNTILLTTLNSMAKNNLITYNEVLCTSIKQDNHTIYRELTDEENKKLEQIKLSILSEMGLVSPPLPYSKLYKNYQSRQNIRITNELDIGYVFKKFVIKPAISIDELETGVEDLNLDDDKIIEHKNLLNEAIYTALYNNLILSTESNVSLDDAGKERCIDRYKLLLNVTIKNEIKTNKDDELMELEKQNNEDFEEYLKSLTE